MCMDWFKKRPPVTWEHSNKVALLFGINQYGGGNNLSGCLNDIDTVKHMLPDFQIREFRDGEVTRKVFKEQLTLALTNAVAGDVIYVHYSGHGTYVPDNNNEELDGFDECLYLTDGPMRDDDLGAILANIPEGVIVALGMDCCYSGTNTRDLTPTRFMPPKKYTPAHRRIKRAIKAGQNYILMSACSENQVSADAYINLKFQGAYTFYAFSCLSRAYTYRQWFDQIRMRLPNKNFDQAPQIEGPDELLDRIVFQ